MYHCKRKYITYSYGDYIKKKKPYKKKLRRNLNLPVSSLQVVPFLGYN